MLIREKLDQARGILRELKIDCWLTFTRESSINGDPCLPFLLDADVTWHTALMVTRAGKAHAIVGQYDKQAVEDLDVYDEVVGFVEGVKAPLQEFLEKENPKTIAVNAENVRPRWRNRLRRTIMSIDS